MIAPLPLSQKCTFSSPFVGRSVSIFPFGSHAHVPIQYLWRPYQLVVWNWNRKTLIKQSPRLLHHPPPLAAQSDPVAQERVVLTR
jgi:hypothetical protein